MEEKKTSAFANGLIWFGAGVSIAEILTGTLIAPLGFGKGVAAIIIGHVIGCFLMYLAGLIGGRTGKSAMETVKLSFGQKGSLLFSGLNVLQLIGWTAVMTISGAAAAASILNLDVRVWCLIIGALIAVWVLVGVRNLDKLNLAAMSALFVLTVVLSFLCFGGQGGGTSGGSLSFGAAIELSVMMPLSWLPLISDYTRTARKPGRATVVSCIVYFFVSCWMYLIGLGAALLTGEGDIAAIMQRAGLGAAGLAVVIFSTVTTTYLDAYSAGVSSVSLSPRLKEKPMALLVCAVGTLIAVLVPIDRFENFLYLIGSVFAPMTAILITDYFILKSDSSASPVNWLNLVLWAVGFGIYRVFLGIDTVFGNTIPVILITIVLSVAAKKLFYSVGRRGKI